MKIKFTNNEVQVLNNCIEKCEKFISLCQDLISSCSVSKNPQCVDLCVSDEKCAEQIGKCAKQYYESANVCKTWIETCKKYMNIPDNDSSKELALCIEKGNKHINEGLQCINQCKNGDMLCIPSCLKSIEVSNQFVKACEQLKK